METVASCMKMNSVSLLYEANIGIKSLSIRLPEAAVYGFLGRNGAGKSTTLSILSGVMRPQSGSIEFKQHRSPYVKTDWKQFIGYVPQTPEFPQGVSPTLLLGFLKKLYPNWQDSRFEAMSEAFQLPLKRKIDTFSIGMKTMLSVSLAYACNPDIYIFDEPTAGLDPVSRRLVLDMIRRESQLGKAVIFSTHIVDDLSENCDYLGIIDNGKLLFEGPIAEFSPEKERLEENYFRLIDHQQAEHV